MNKAANQRAKHPSTGNWLRWGGAVALGVGLLIGCGQTTAPQAALPLPDSLADNMAGEGVPGEPGLRPETLSTSSINAQGYDFRTLKVGAGGFITGLDISAGGTLWIARTDTYGLYRWTGSVWKQLLTAQSLPAGDVKPGQGPGVIDVSVSQSRFGRVYMAWNGKVYRSENKGDTWLATGLNLGERLQNANDDWRTWGGKLVADVKNADIVLLGTPRDGLQRSTNAGATWTRISSLPAGKPERADGSGPGITAMAFDKARAGVVYASSHKNGIYRSGDSGATWTRLPGGPSTLARAEVASDGTLYGASGQGAWRYRGGAWKQLVTGTAGDLVSVAVSPNDARRILAMSGGGQLSQSRDGGDTWTNLQRAQSGGDIPWIDQRDPDGSLYFSTAQVRFHPQKPNEVWTANGVGIFRAPLTPSDTGIRWKGQSRGIEQLVGNDVVAPPGGKPVVAAWDFGTFYINDPEQYAARMAVPRPGSNFNSNWNLDYQGGNPRFLVGNTSDHRYCCAEDGVSVQAGYSEDGGQTWKRFATIPGITGLQNGENAFGFGDIAVSSDNPDNIVWMPTFNRTPVYTTDRGRTWNGVYLPGLDFAGERAGSHFALYLSRKILTADKNLPGTFYLAHSGVKRGSENVGAGLWRTSNAGRTWAKVYAGEIGQASVYNALLKSVPGQAGHLFFTSGPLEGEPGFRTPFRRSDDGGVTWRDVPGLNNVHAFGFGKAAAGKSKATLFAAGFRGSEWGLWRSTDDAQSWKKIGDYPQGSFDTIKAIDGDKTVFGKVYLAYGGSGFGYGLDTTVSGAAQR